MDGIRTFLLWLVRAGGKPESLLFKNQREAAEFVRRHYAPPNKELRSVYSEYKKIKQNGVSLATSDSQDHRKAL